MSRFWEVWKLKYFYKPPPFSKQAKFYLIKKLTVLRVISLHVSNHYYLIVSIMCKSNYFSCPTAGFFTSKSSSRKSHSNVIESKRQFTALSRNVKSRPHVKFALSNNRSHYHLRFTLVEILHVSFHFSFLGLHLIFHILRSRVHQLTSSHSFFYQISDFFLFEVNLNRYTSCKLSCVHKVMFVSHHLLSQTACFNI